MLEVDKIEKRFGGLVAVNQVSLKVAAGEIVALIGPNGAGKTTLFNLVAGALPCDAGAVRFRGRSLAHLDGPRICRAGLARTFQIPQLFASMSVLDTVMVAALSRTANIDAAREQARTVIAQTGLSERERQPGTTLTLSGKKRLEIARALATRPAMILLDEVMAGLNPSEVRPLLDLIRTLRTNGMTVMLVEHNIEAVLNVADRVVVLNQGRKIADALPREALRQPDVIRAYLGEDYAVA